MLLFRITAWNRLKLVWKESEQARKELCSLGFNFNPGEFSKDNGAQGKIPVSAAEFKKIGLYTKVFLVMKTPGMTLFCLPKLQ